MKKLILDFHVELYTILVAVLAILGAFQCYEMTAARKMLLILILIGVLHEYEEKKIPGGFFENLGGVWGWDMESVDFRKTGQWAVYAWMVIAGIPFVLDHVTGLVLAPTFLGIFEMIIHTAGKKICHIKGWYVPGIVTGWLLGIVSIYEIYRVDKLFGITVADYLTGILCVVCLMLILQMLVQKSAGSSIPKMIAHMKSQLKK